jgi:hypothetical protein
MKAVNRDAEAARRWAVKLHPRDLPHLVKCNLELALHFWDSDYERARIFLGLWALLNRAVELLDEADATVSLPDLLEEWEREDAERVAKRNRRGQPSNIVKFADYRKRGAVLPKVAS